MNITVFLLKKIIFILNFSFFIQPRTFCSNQGWEFIKENKKVRKKENRTRPRKRSRKQENKRKKTRSRPRKRPRKKRKKILSFFIVFWSSSCFLSFFLAFLFSYVFVFFYKFPPQHLILFWRLKKMMDEIKKVQELPKVTILYEHVMTISSLNAYGQ